jgi:hypothetical protein
MKPAEKVANNRSLHMNMFLDRNAAESSALKEAVRTVFEMYSNPEVVEIQGRPEVRYV